jgi:hypothetical protein
LERLITSEFAKVPRVKLVVKDDPKTHLHVAVVVTQLEGPDGKDWFVASSAIEAATDKGQDLLFTHDVLAAHDLASLAHVVAFPLGGFIARVSLGLDQ